MRISKKSIIFYILVMVCTVSCFERKGSIEVLPQASTPPVDYNTQENSESRADRIARFIKNKLKGSAVESLKDKEIPANSKEVRIWVNLANNELRGVFLRQDNDKWQSYYLLISEVEPSAIKMRTLMPPKVGWDIFWNKLGIQELFSLPDADEVGANYLTFDVESVFVEIKTDTYYRAYVYIGYLISDKMEAKKVAMIIKIISQQFNLKLSNEE